MPTTFIPEKHGEMVEEILADLRNGRSMNQICKAKHLPCYASVKEWMLQDADLSDRIMQAREVGYELRAEQAIQDAKSADDAALGRLAFDAERWYLGKLSNAFSDNKMQKHAVAVTPMTEEEKAWLGIPS